jgi:hypothetical protein
MLRAKYEKITPNRATKLLEHNTDNYRMSISNSTLENLVYELTHGQWKATTQGIGFDTNGVLVDGQHRLMAIQKSGITVDKQLVCYGLEPESKLKIDVGKKRTLADLSQISSRIISTIRIPFRFVYGSGNKTMSLTYMKPYITGDLGRLTKKLHKMCPAYYGILSAGMRAGLMMAIMSGKISEKEGLQMFGKLTKLRQNSKGQYLNTSIKSRREIEESLPLLLVSLLEKIRQGLVPVFTGTEYVDKDYDVRERSSKIMLVAMQAFDNTINDQEEFTSPCYNTITDVLGI